MQEIFIQKPPVVRLGMPPSRVAALGALIVLLYTALSAFTPLKGPPCLFRLALHLPCPGCGMTRSLMQLWHGNLFTSFRYHPLGLPLFVACAAFIVAYLLSLLSIGGPYRVAMQWLSVSRLPIVCGALLIAFWGLRLGFILSRNSFFLW